MPIVSAQDVEKSFADRRLFAHATFALETGDHVVLVGANGTGKTSLLRLLAGAEHPDSGSITRARGRRVWLHDQTPELERDRPVRDYLLGAFAEAVRLEDEVRRAEERLSGLAEESPELHAEMRAYQQLQRAFEAAGGYTFHGRLNGVAEGLGLQAEVLDRQLLSLSGGELTRVTLARALLADADLLLLDEPTNHLDIDSVEWLQGFLAEYAHAFVLVTHDRRLLEAVGRRVLAVEHGTLTVQTGDFATYQRESAARLDLMRREYEQDLEKIAQLQHFYDRFHAKRDKAKQAKAKLTQIERIKRGLKPPPRESKGIHLGLPAPTPSARVVLEMRTPALVAGSVDDGGRTLIRDLDLTIERGQRVALVGPNGSGKTTLIETVAGNLSLATGAAHLGHNVHPAFFSQQGRELSASDTMLAVVLPLLGYDEEQSRALLGRFGLGPDEVDKLVGSLSGGERSRLRLLALLVGGANFLLLDEPTNHLDVGSVEALSEALAAYQGTLLFITHDRYLIDRVATRVVEIVGEGIVNHLSPGRYWEARAARLEEAAGAPAKSAPRAASQRQAAPAGAALAERRSVSAEEARRQRARLRAAEAAILKAEKRLGAIDNELAEPETYGDRGLLDRLLAQRAEIERGLQKEYDEWERLVDEQAQTEVES